jgi:hypothetical protein
LNDQFRRNIEDGIQERHGIDVTIEIKTPHQEKGLQAVDCLAWSFFRKYEYGDSSYADIVASRVIEENSLYGTPAQI